LRSKAFLIGIFIVIIASSLIASTVFFILNEDKRVLSITSDEDLIALNFPGEGTESNPYIIEDYNFGLQENKIDGYITLLEISNISKHVIIRDNSFDGGHIGIYVKDVYKGNIKIEENVFNAEYYCFGNICTNSFYGIKIRGSKNISVEKNFFPGFNYTGYFYAISVEESRDIVLKNNNISNAFSAMVVLYSSNLLVESNIFENNVEIYIEGSSFFTINNNTFENLFRYEFWYSNNIEITNNIIKGRNFEFGILFHYSGNILIEGNLISNKSIGIGITSSREFTIRNNLIVLSQNYGIFLSESSFEITIYDNYFINNNLNSSLSQALDNGYFNIWYDVETSHGNYWSDLGESDTYSLDGLSESSDLFPKDEPIKFNVFNSFLFLNI
jgi:parallel beta-helix repeat protein